MTGGVGRDHNAGAMLLSITATVDPPSSGDPGGARLATATDLGFLLHKHPDRVQVFDVGFGRAHVLYPEVELHRCTATLLVEVDADRLGRRSRRARSGPTAPGAGFALTASINDRPYAASSLLSVALGRVFRSAVAGTCATRPELVDLPIALEVHLPVLSCRGGAGLLDRLFGPLGFAVDARAIALDAEHPEWGASRFLDVRLRTVAPLRDVLAQIYVLLPVLDDDKHYWVEASEIDKLLRHGGAWLAGHPDRELITRRYLRHRPRLTREALDRLIVVDGEQADADGEAAAADLGEAEIERPISLNQQRLDAVAATLVAHGCTRIADVGCGEGRLVERLLREPSIEHIQGLDAAMRVLHRAADRLHLDTMSPRQRARVDLGQGSFLLRDERVRSVDAVAAVEVVEHVDPARLDAFVDAVLGWARPRVVVVTTPNVEHNVRFEGMAPGSLRHRDHRFEWTRDELASWAAAAADAHGYRVELSGIGTDDPEVGPPTQMAVFVR